jgi:TPR repeat protein
MHEGAPNELAEELFAEALRMVRARKQPQNAATRFRAAIELGHAPSQHRFAQLLWTGAAGVECDRAEAWRLFQATAAAGHTDAQRHCGLLACCRSTAPTPS